MKVTIVIEFNVPDDTPTHGVEGIVNDCLADRLPAQFGFRIMETTAAPYGPQHPGGVILTSDRRKRLNPTAEQTRQIDRLLGSKDPKQ